MRGAKMSVLCERCSAELDHGVTLPQWARGPIWTVAGEERRVPPRLRRLFKILWSRRDRHVSVDSFMMLLYQTRSEPPEENIVRVIISQLRRVLDGSEWRIINSWGCGWRLVPAVEAVRSPLSRAWTDTRREVNRLRRLRSRGLALQLSYVVAPNYGR
jgi:DNA-binding winged helix-turn-helix (wHTH) protein